MGIKEDLLKKVKAATAEGSDDIIKEILNNRLRYEREEEKNLGMNLEVSVLNLERDIGKILHQNIAELLQYFLSDYCGYNQTDNTFAVYPNIIERINEIIKKPYNEISFQNKEIIDYISRQISLFVYLKLEK